VRSSNAHRRASTALGCLFALAMFELGLRPFSSPYDDDWHSVRIGSDPDDGPSSETRYYHEGVATSHFSPAYSRLTGNPFLSGQPVGVVIGDSYVQAVQVRDTETMGSIIERRARAQGSALNVRQYGWAGAAPAAYVALARAVLERWHPAWVVVVLNDGDLVSRSLSDWPTAELRPDTSLRVVGSIERTVGGDGVKGILAGAVKSLLRRSALAWQIYYRLDMIRSASRSEGDADTQVAAFGGDESVDELIPLAAIRSLKAAYGSRLRVLYVAVVPASGNPPDSSEFRLLRACANEAVRCASTRAPMLEARQRTGDLARGFSNTAPGVGHLNALGHRIAADAIWELIAPVNGVALPDPKGHRE
jgi:hypothetical protein